MYYIYGIILIVRGTYLTTCVLSPHAIVLTSIIYIYIYIYTYEYRVSGHLYEYRVSGQFTSWIYINKINITLHFFTHVETVGVGYINNYFFISSL